MICGPWFKGANANLSAVVMQAGGKTVLVEETGGGKKVPPGALYEWDAGQLSVVSVLGSGTPIGVKGDEEPTLGTSPGSESESLRGAVSEDGSRVVWSEVFGGYHLFVWDRASGRSAQVNAKQGGASGEGKVEPIFQFATTDGSRVFFTDTQALTSDAGEKESEHLGDLYECKVVVEEAGPKCVLSDLTPKTAGGENAGVLGEVIGASNDTSTIYFAANGILAENAVKGDCERGGSPSKQECNLYDWHDGKIELVAVLSGEDAADWGTADGGEAPSLADHVGRVTGNGEWLAFMSDRSLTGYDNRDVHSGKPDEEVYLYNSTSKSLVCVSCNPTGERPNGVEGKRLVKGLLDVGMWKEETWLAANVPGWTPFRVDQASYQSRYLDEDGRMFFNSSDNLVPGDTNGQEDVYEYEPVGVGSCQVGGEGYFPQDGGCLGLVSSGESPEESAFLDASENGNDVFFLTASRLSKRDTDTTLDVYDARVGGVPSEESKPVECQGDACQSPVTPPESLTPSSLTSNGVGNLLTPPAPGPAPKPVVKKKPETRGQKLAKALKQCRRDRSKAKKRACERRARRKFRR